MKNYFITPLLIILLLLQPMSSTLAQSAQDNNYSIIQIAGADFANLLNEMGITFYQGEEGKYIAVVDDSQLNQIQSHRVPFVVLKSRGSRGSITGNLATNSGLEVSPLASGGLQNSYLRVSINDNGQFTMQDTTAGQRYLLFPAPETSYLSINVDGQVYTNSDLSLAVITPLTILDSSRAYIVFQTPENVQVRLNYTLMDSALQLKIDFQNTDSAAHWVRARYLLDTQVDTNDGSPLYAPPVSVRTYETDIPYPSFSSWQGYDIWPNPSLTTFGTLSTSPYRVAFAHWPRAFGSYWDYTVDPAEAFFTPGYTTSPQSDSCVLEYFDVGTLASNGTGQIITYYGLGIPSGGQNREQLINAYRELSEAAKASLDNDARSFSRSLALYYSTMEIRLDAKWYIEAGWDIFSLSLPNPRLGRSFLMRTLARDFNMLNDIADAVTVTDYGAQLGVSIAQLFKTIPPGLSTDQISNNYLLPYIMDQHPFGSYTGINGLKQSIDNQFQTTINAIPDPLPSSYPVETVVASLKSQTYALRRSIYVETSVPFLSNRVCMNDVKAGVMNNLEKEMVDLSAKIETADSFEFVMTVGEIGVWAGAGAVKIASLAGVITAIPGEAVFWGTTAAIATVPGIFGAGATVYSLTNKGYFTGESYKVVGQLASDAKMLTSLFQSSSEYALQPVNLPLQAQTNLLQINQINAVASAGLNFVSMEIPDALVANGENFATANGTITLQNASSANMSVSIFGDITAQTGSNTEIVGLLGTGAPATLQVGETKALPFSFVALRSSLIDFTGYDIHVFVSYLKEGTAERGSIGPFVRHIFVGTQDQLLAWNNHQSQSLYPGQLTEGEVFTQDVHVTSGAKSSRLMLSFAEASDLDLHLYDSLGRHSGMNYQTGIVENQIPGVTYSGTTSWPEWIVIDAPTTETYQAKVIATSTLAGGNFDLSQLDVMPIRAMIDTAGQTGWSFVRLSSDASQSESYDFTVREVGGTSSAQINSVIPSAFQSDTGHVLPASKIVCSNNVSIPAGGQGVFSCSVTVDPSTIDGTYTGQIQISGQGTDGTPVSAMLAVVLALNNNNGIDTTGVFRPSNGVLFLKNQNTTGIADIGLNYGNPGDYPVVGDWDGNGTVTIGIYRNGSFYLRNSNTIGFADMVFAFGVPGDQPVAGDWDGDGVDTIGVYHPSNGQFMLRNSNSAGAADTTFFLGNPGDVGIAGDWNGDGMDTTGVFRPSNGVIFLKNFNTTGIADVGLNYGIPGDKPVIGDWDGDGTDTIGVYRTGIFMLRNSNTVGFADIVFGLGNPGDMPIAGNWDGSIP